MDAKGGELVKNESITEQYKTEKNLETRMSIYEYAVNPETFAQWQKQHIQPGEKLKILELGCGTGSLWKELLVSFPDCEITLSDLSEGMLEKSKDTLGTDKFIYQIIDYHNIPYEENSFDVVISNHNLYHAMDLDKAVSEIHRVLKVGGVFYSTTNSSEHLLELRDLINKEKEVIWSNAILTAAYGSENGAAILGKVFSQVQADHYSNELRIPDFSLLENYLLSVRDQTVHELYNTRKEKMIKTFQSQIDEKGYFGIRTRATLFTALK